MLRNIFNIGMLVKNYKDNIKNISNPISAYKFSF